jgi:hypothetical protein
MEQGKIINDISSLPPEAQRQIVEFIAFLKTRYTRHRGKKQLKQTDLVNEPFIGIWKDREDMKDSSTWLRNIRKTEWG